MKRIVFLTVPDIQFGFRLTGVTHETLKEEELDQKLRDLMLEETGLVVIDERLISGIAETKLREMEKRWYGILLVLPAPKRPGVALEDYAMRLIRRAIGYHVRLSV